MRNKAWSAEDNARRLEDLQFMAATGETLDGALQRLTLTRESLEKWCDRHDHRPLLNHLIANADAPGHGARRGRFALGVVA